MIESDGEGAAVGGALTGKQWQPRDIAAELYAAGALWQDALVLMEGVQVTLAESQGFDRAFNDNTAAIGTVPVGSTVRNALTYELYHVSGRDGTSVLVVDAAGDEERFPPEALVVLSRDVGLMQINIPAAQITTTVEANLYDVQTNVTRAYGLYVARGWQPWAAWNSRVCFRDTYVKRAARGVGDYLAHVALATPPDAAAKPRYLTDPVLDYTYRLAGALHYLAAVRADLVALKPHLNPVNADRVNLILKDVALGLGFKRADHPWS